MTHRRFLLSLGFILGGCLLATAGLNVIVDPFKVFCLVENDFLDGKKRKLRTRLAKAERLHSSRPEVLLLGNSRVYYGLNPAHGAFKNREVYNGAVPGCSLAETLLMLETVLAKNDRLEQVIIGIDHSWVYQDAGEVSPEMLATRFNPAASEAKYLVDQLFSFYSLENSLQTLSDALLVPSEITIHDRGHVSDAYLAWKAAGDDLSHRFRRYIKKGLIGTPDSAKVNSATVAAVQSVIEKCEARNVRLTFFFLPVHALLLECELRDAQAEERIEVSKRKLAALAAGSSRCDVWDFALHDFYTTEHIEALVVDPQRKTDQADLDWFWEPSHFKEKLGSLMLDRMFSSATSVPPIGKKITPENADSWFVETRQNRRRYLVEEVENLRWVDQTAVELGVQR